MSLTLTPSCVLHRELVRLYMGKTILSDTGVPFTVERVEVTSESLEPNWIVLFNGHQIGPARRYCLLNERLPEVWPFEPPMSPCS